MEAASGTWISGRRVFEQEMVTIIAQRTVRSVVSTFPSSYGQVPAK